MASRDVILSTLKNLSGEGGEVSRFDYEDESDSFTAVVRSKYDEEPNDMSHYSEWCSKWIEEFSNLTTTNWIVRYTYPNKQKYHFRKVYRCHHNNFDKVKKRKRDDTRQRDQDCGAKISLLFKKTNRDTIRNDPLLQKGLSVVIEISFKHSHKVVVSEAFSYLRISKDTEAKFCKYFDDGMTAAAAKNFHEISLENENDESEIAKILANAQLNPTERQIKHLYTKWRKVNFGGRKVSNMLDVLKKKKECYEDQNIKVIIQENPMITVVLTPIMMRAHCHEFAHEMVFVDSSGSCDQTSTCVTFFFAATKVGAIPLACILYTEQTEKNYTESFQLLRNTLGHDSFGGYGFPRIFMTDDSTAEREALKSVFPESRRLLCIFHVLQAFWRWLWDSKHNIDKTDRKPIMTEFRKMLYSSTNEELRDSYSKFMNNELVKMYGNLEEHILGYWERKEEWSLACRSNLLTRGNNTNNYVEASIRIFKDIVLQRCKAFNACALIDFIAKVLESYHKRHLLLFANHRSSQNELAFRRISKSSALLSVQEIDENTCLVSSQNDENLFYTVHLDVAFCDCIYGQGGRFCKHLCAIQNKYGKVFSTSLKLTIDDRIVYYIPR